MQPGWVDRLLASWNAARFEALLPLMSDDIVITLRGGAATARPNPLASGQGELMAFLARIPGELPRFALISLLEDDASACLSLVDQSGVRLNAICGLGEGRIQRMALFRPLPA